jgi:hypothetical protein
MQINYKGIVTLRKNESSIQNISLILLQMKMLQGTEVRSPAKRPTHLISALSVPTLHDLAATLKVVF